MSSKIGEGRAGRRENGKWISSQRSQPRAGLGGVQRSAGAAGNERDWMEKSGLGRCNVWIISNIRSACQRRGRSELSERLSNLQPALHFLHIRGVPEFRRGLLLRCSSKCRYRGPMGAGPREMGKGLTPGGPATSLDRCRYLPGDSRGSPNRIM